MANVNFKSICLLFVVLLSTPTTLNAASWWADDSYNHGQMQANPRVLAEAALRGEVLFIDTREPEEHAEGHIPFSVNVRLMDVDDIDISDLRRYAYVVPYCLKDFRGFEVARALREKGLSNVVMMEPAGLKGWLSLGLPTVKRFADSAAVLSESMKRQRELAVSHE